MPDDAELAELLNSLTAPTPSTRITEHSQALAKHLQSPCVHPLFTQLTTHPTPAARTLATTLLRTHQLPHLLSLPPDSLSAFAKGLLQACLPAHPDTRRAIILLLRQLPLPEDVEPLLPEVSRALRQQDATAFAQSFLFEQTPATLAEGLQHPSAEVRLAAVAAFVRLSRVPPDGVAELVPGVLSVSAADPAASAHAFEAMANLVVHPMFTPLFERVFHHALDVFSSAPLEAAAPAVEFLVYAVEVRTKTVHARSFDRVAIQSACAVLYKGDCVDLVESREFLACRLLDAIASKSQLSQTAFIEAYTIITASQAPIPALRILAAVAEGCATEITVHAEEVLMRVLSGPGQGLQGPAAAVRLDCLTAVVAALDINEMPDPLVYSIAQAAVGLVIAGLADPVDRVRKAACVALEPVLALFKTGEIGGHANAIVDALTPLDASLSVEAVLAVGVLAENASDALVSSPKFQVLLRRTVEIMVRSSSDDALATAAAYEAAGSLVSVIKDVSVVNVLAEHALPGLESEDPTVKQGAFSFFANLVDENPGYITIFGERVLTAATESVLMKDVFVIPDAEGNPQDVDADNADDNGTVQVRTAYLDEKMVALGCMGAFGTAAGGDEFIRMRSSNPGNTIAGLLTRAAELADSQTGHFHGEIRASAHRASCRLSGANATLLGKDPRLGFCSPAYADRVLTLLLEGLKDDEDITVVTELANTFSIFLEELPLELVIQRREDIREVVTTLIAGDSTCQFVDEDHEIGDDEVDTLVEGLCEIVEALARKLRGYFAEHFLDLVDGMLKTFYTGSQSGRKRGTVLGMLAGVLLFMSWDRCSFTPAVGETAYTQAIKSCEQLAGAALPLAIEGLQFGESRTLQRNAVFLLGVAYQRAPTNTARVTDALDVLRRVVRAGKTSNGALVDNAAGALARIATSVKGIPKEEVLTLALEAVPMVDDPVENTTLARAIVRGGGLGVATAAVRMRALSCLVSAVLIFAARRASCRWVVTSDPNERIVGLDDEEFAMVVAVLRSSSEAAGGLQSVALADADRVVLERVLGSNV